MARWHQWVIANGREAPKRERERMSGHPTAKAHADMWTLARMGSSPIPTKRVLGKCAVRGGIGQDMRSGATRSHDRGGIAPVIQARTVEWPVARLRESLPVTVQQPGTASPN
jgi:hypothetical protein